MSNQIQYPNRVLNKEGLSYLWTKIKSALSGKADKASNAIDGNFASLDANGNLKDSGHKHSDYATKTDTVLDTTLSRGRATGTTVGAGSFAFGKNVAAQGNYSSSIGEHTTAYGQASHVTGRYNANDTYLNWPIWTVSHSYVVGDKVQRVEDNVRYGYICKTNHTSSSEFDPSYWDLDTLMNYAEIVGNGTNTNNKSNARAVDWNGNEYLKGDLYVGCNADSTSGTKVVKSTDVMVGASSSAAGASGLVPSPSAGEQAEYLRGDGTWNAVKTPQSAVSDPTASGTSATFIATISQNTNGVITPTKKTVRTFTGSGSSAATGLVPAPSTTAGTTKYLREDATWQVPPNTNTWRGYQIKKYTYTYTLSSGAAIDITASQLGFSTPSGYTPVAVARIATADNKVVVRSFNVLTSGDGIALSMRNVGSSSASSKSLTYEVLYLQTG